LEDVFRAENFVAEITYKTSIGLGSAFLDPVCNYLIWFTKNKPEAEQRYHQLYRPLTLGAEGATRYSRVESAKTGEGRLLSEEEQEDPTKIAATWRPYTDQGLTSRSGSSTTGFPVTFNGGTHRPQAGGWRTGQAGMGRVIGADRVMTAGSTIQFKKFFDDFGALALTNFWPDVGGGIQGGMTRKSTLSRPRRTSSNVAC
jgi:adenine-specific DNA-methyltransferase